MMAQIEPGGRYCYRVYLAEQLAPTRLSHWTRWRVWPLPQAGAILEGAADRAELASLLQWLYDLGLTLVGLERSTTVEGFSDEIMTNRPEG